jgi:hypothetical protein
MSVAQALAIAAASWMMAMTMNPSVSGVLHRAQEQAEHLASRLETATTMHLMQINDGFGATPDGLRMERTARL